MEFLKVYIVEYYHGTFIWKGKPNVVKYIKMCKPDADIHDYKGRLTLCFSDSWYIHPFYPLGFLLYIIKHLVSKS